MFFPAHKTIGLVQTLFYCDGTRHFSRLIKQMALLALLHTVMVLHGSCVQTLFYYSGNKTNGLTGTTTYFSHSGFMTSGLTLLALLHLKWFICSDFMFKVYFGSPIGDVSKTHETNLTGTTTHFPPTVIHGFRLCFIMMVLDISFPAHKTNGLTGTTTHFPYDGSWLPALFYYDGTFFPAHKTNGCTGTTTLIVVHLFRLFVQSIYGSPIGDVSKTYETNLT
jgi:hypothetical protein